MVTSNFYQTNLKIPQYEVDESTHMANDYLRGTWLHGKELRQEKIGNRTIISLIVMRLRMLSISLTEERTNESIGLLDELFTHDAISWMELSQGK